MHLTMSEAKAAMPMCLTLRAVPVSKRLSPRLQQQQGKTCRRVSLAMRLGHVGGVHQLCPRRRLKNLRTEHVDEPHFDARAAVKE